MSTFAWYVVHNSSQKFTMKDLLEYIKFQIMDKNVLLSNQIAGFFDDQCRWKESDKVLGFLFRNSYPGKIPSKTATVGLG